MMSNAAFFQNCLYSPLQIVLPVEGELFDEVERPFPIYAGDSRNQLSKNGRSFPTRQHHTPKKTSAGSQFYKFERQNAEWPCRNREKGVVASVLENQQISEVPNCPVIANYYAERKSKKL